MPEKPFTFGRKYGIITKNGQLFSVTYYVILFGGNIMPDFNNKKEILRRLKAKKNNNKALWLPCTAAELCVKAWYAAVCRLGLIFSDRNGRFLGVGHVHDKPKSRRADDIVYVKKPFFGRLLSALLAAAFVMMFMPELNIDFSASAVDVGDSMTFVDEHGVEYHVKWYDVSQSLVYKVEDETKVKNYQIDSLQVESSYNAIHATWDFDVTKLGVNDGYHVIVSSPNAQKAIEETDLSRLRKEWESSVPLSPNLSYSFITKTYSNIDLYVYNEYKSEEVDDQGNQKILKSISLDTQHRKARIEGMESVQEIPPLGKTLTVPKPAKMDDLEGGATTATIRWQPSTTVGVDGDGSVDGYRVYRWDMRKNTYSVLADIPGTAAVTDGYISTSDTVAAGGHYRYIVESYKILWDVNGGNKYNEENPGMITSSGALKDGSLKEKFDSYMGQGNDYYTELYVAPNMPDLTLDPQPNNHLIKVGWGDKTGSTSDGVFLFRSTKRIPDEMWEGSYDSLTKYLLRIMETTGEVTDTQKDITIKFLIDPASNVRAYEDKDIVAKQDYWYYLISYTDKGDGTRLHSAPNFKSSNMDLTLDPPQNLTPVASDGKVELTWDKVDHADGYMIKITKLDKDGKPLDEDPVIIGNIKSTKYTHNSFKGKDLYYGETYQYEVQAYANVKTEDGDILPSGYCYPRQATVGIPIKSPQGIKAEPADGQITVSWEKVPGAEGYRIYYKVTTKEGVVHDYDYKKNVFDVGSKTSKIHQGLRNGDRYTYKVEPYKTVSGKEVTGPMSEEAWAIVGVPLDAPKDLIGTPADGKIDLKWTASKGAEGYILHIIKEGNEVETFDVSKTSFSHTGLKNGDVYSYRVTAYKTVNGERVLSSDSNTVTYTVGVPLDAPKDLTATTKDGQVDLKWTASRGAEGYILSISKDGALIDEVDVSKTSYSHTRLLNNDNYSYRVRAYKTVNGKRFYSDYSNEVFITVGDPLNTPMDFTGTVGDGMVTLKWTAIRGVTGYKLHITVNGVEQEVVDLSKPGYVHTGLNNGDKVEYYVVAYKTVNGKPVYSDRSVTLSFIIGLPLSTPLDFTGTASDGKVELEWTAVNGASGYTLYFRRNGGAWQSVDLSKPGFEHIGLNNGDRYDYYVTAYKDVNGKRVQSAQSNMLSFTIGDLLEMPRDFNAVTTDGQVTLTWTAVRGAEGYVVYAYGGGRSYQFDITKNSYVHNNLDNNDSWTYYVVAYKTVNGTRVYSSPTKSITVTVGVSLNAVIDLVATAGNRQIDLAWTAVKGAEGYVVYLYNSKTMEFEPITVISGTKYSHTGLKNGTKYTYMVAPYKTIGGTRYYGEYSMSVSATPSLGSNTDIDNELTVKGTTPYGISHSEYIDASANHGAFDEPVDVYFTTNKESTEAVTDVLKNYANGLRSFIIYPFDISIYREGTREKVSPNDGYSVTITMPIPDRLIAYRDYITVVHIGDGLEELDDTTEITMDDTEDWLETEDSRLEVLPCAIVDIDNVWCVQFVCTSFSPYALVIYKDHLTDVSASGGIIDGSFAGTFNSGVLLFTALPDILPNDKRLKVVREKKKRYHIKSIEKIR